MEAVLTKQSRIPPRTAVAKPVSAAIAIGTGGPFGAEGPIIVTGGALGSLIGQVVHVSPAEREILLACGGGARRHASGRSHPRDRAAAVRILRTCIRAPGRGVVSGRGDARAAVRLWPALPCSRPQLCGARQALSILIARTGMRPGRSLRDEGPSLERSRLPPPAGERVLASD